MGRIIAPFGLKKTGGGKGWLLDLDGTYNAVAANNTIHDITTEDIGIWAWIKIPTDYTAHGIVIAKRSTVNEGFQLDIRDYHVRIYMEDDDGDNYLVTGTTNLNDGEPHFVAAIIDRSNAANCKVYVDGADNTAARHGTLANVGSLTNTAIATMGSTPTGGSRFDGIVAELGIAYPADIMAANEMGAPGEIASLYNNFRNPSAYPNLEDRWACDEGTGTTLTGDNNNLTLSNAVAWVWARTP